MPLMRDITCVTSSNSSRDRQRSTAAAGSSPMLSSTIAACSTGVSLVGMAYSPPSSSMLLSSAIFLHPLFDDFGYAFRLFCGQHFQVVDHDIHGRAWWRQIVVFQQRHHWHARLRRAAQGRRCARRAWRSGASQYRLFLGRSFLGFLGSSHGSLL